MKVKSVKQMMSGVMFVFMFALWTILIQNTDVRPIGVNGTDIGFATLNTWFHRLTDVNMTLYNITDWLGLVPVFVCIAFGVLGFAQFVRRKSLIKVDFDIIVSGVYYIIVIACYLLFEMHPINYRPILINGFMEASYPSSTTLLVLCVMPTLSFQVKNRVENNKVRGFLCVFSVLFSAFMVVGRLLSGVHWLTDIVGSVFLSVGLVYIYKAIATIKKSGDCYGV